jgi:hypothetical protein
VGAFSLPRRTAVRTASQDALPDAPTLTGETLASAVSIGVVPAAQGSLAGVAPTREQLRTQLTAEYVSAGGYAAWINYARALPQAIDDLTTDMGDDLYVRMMLDPQVSSVINVLRASVLEDGCRFEPAIGDEEDPQHGRAVERADWCTAVMKRLKPGLDVTLWDLTEAFALGNRVAELVWEVAPDPLTKRPALLLKAIKTKPRSSTSFVVDSYNNLLGLLAVEVGRAWPLQQNIYVTKLDQIPNLLPKEKFCVLSFRTENNDPRGSSPLRAAWDPWWLAKQSRSQYLLYLSQVAVPSAIGYPPEDAEAATEDADGNPLTAAQIVSPEMAMAKSLETLRNGMALSFPHGSEVQFLEPKTDGSVFERFEDRQDKRITKSILLQLLATEESRHQTRASTGQHKDILDTLVRQIRRQVESMLAEQVIRLLILFNFGEEALALAPVPTLGRTEQHDFATMAAGIAALESSGYLGESQKPGIDSMLGLPVRDAEADAAAVQAALDAATQARAQNPEQAPGGRVIDKSVAGGQAASARAAAGQSGGDGATAQEGAA